MKKQKRHRSRNIHKYIIGAAICLMMFMGSQIYTTVGMEGNISCEAVGYGYQYANGVYLSAGTFSESGYRLLFSVIAAAVSVLFVIILILVIDRLRKNKISLWQTAYIDPLTGSGNLNFFKEEARKLLDKNPHTHYVISRFDIDKFKIFNEIYGFEFGDKILRELARVIESIIIPGVDTYARISGNDFIILKSYTVEGESQALRIATVQKFLDSIGHEFDYLVKLKFGIYYIIKNEESVSSILEKVNYAHSTCKDVQNLDSFIYDDSVRQKAVDEKRIESRMQDALAKRQFMLYLQPKYYLSDETLAGAEALVRWSSEDGENIVYPNSFIPLFEKNGFITKLDMYMLERTCELIHSWIEEGITPITVSINFSRLHLINQNFTKEICALTDRYAVPRKYIEVELTESTMFNNEETMLTVLEDLHEAGFTLSMDDFGTGYSSLGLLKNLPVDVIKIDRNFFVNDRYKSRSRTVIENVMQMARHLNIHTVAEGVESREHIDFLKEMGCDVVQGFYYSKPMPAEEFNMDSESRPVPKLRREPKIAFQDIGDLAKGRGSIGEEMPVLVYRLFNVALRKTLKEMYGDGEMADILRETGRVAGSAFAKEYLDLTQAFEQFIDSLTDKLLQLKIGKLKVESFDMDTGNGIIVISDDLDCSGISDRHETLCQYDEGFIAGILNEYTKKSYSVVEIDCWGTGANVCRFEVNQK